MKFYTLLSVFVLGVTAAPSVTLEHRKVPPLINSESIALIKHLEGFSANYYVINGHQTIGYGHDCAELGCGNIHPPISEGQATVIFFEDVTQYESCVCGLPNSKFLSANQYGALVSFTYNSGCGAVNQYFHGSMARKDFNGICASLSVTNTLGGQLSSRRGQEAAFCKRPTSVKSECT